MAARAESLELAEFGHEQELERSLSSFSSFQPASSYISILTGVFQLFNLRLRNRRTVPSPGWCKSDAGSRLAWN